MKMTEPTRIVLFDRVDKLCESDDKHAKLLFSMALDTMGVEMARLSENIGQQLIWFLDHIEVAKWHEVILMNPDKTMFDITGNPVSIGADRDASWCFHEAVNGEEIRIAFVKKTGTGRIAEAPKKHPRPKPPKRSLDEVLADRKGRTMTFRYPRTAVPDDTGKLTAAYRATCDHCGGEDHVKAGNSGSLALPGIERHLERKGWKTGKKLLCPSCNPEARKMMNGETPRQMTPADKRRVFREIDDHWNEKISRYEKAETDHTIADRLNVPRVWVEEVRKEAFGETQRNEAFDAMLQRVRDLESECRATMDKLLASAAKAEEMTKRCADTLEKLEKLA